MQLGGRYRPPTATWYEDLDRDDTKLKQHEYGVSNVFANANIPNAPTQTGQQAVDDLRIDGLSMLNRMTDNMSVGFGNKKKFDIRGKIY